MVKLASARESRLYGPWLTRNRWEYINGGLYVFATVLLFSGFLCQFFGYKSAKSGMVVLLVSSAIITLVNVHDLLAHFAGIDYRMSVLWYDTQLLLVEFAVPMMLALGWLLFFLGVLFFFIQAEKGNDYSSQEKHALNMLIAGPILWVIGSIHNACQIYERADGHVQFLQQCVLIPFLIGSFMFFVGAIVNIREHIGLVQHGLMLLGNSWAWFGIFGSLLFLYGGLMNLVKVFKLQQMDGIRLEKLRGGAQAGLILVREGQVPLILEEQSRRRKQMEDPRSLPVPITQA